MKSINMEDLKNNEYFLFYEMMVQALKTDNVDDGINYSLYLLKEYLDSGNVILYKKEQNGTYSCDISDASMKLATTSNNCIVNKIAPIVEKKRIYDLNLNLSASFKEIILLHLSTNDNSYILSINNPNKDRITDDDFWTRLKEAMQITMKRAESYERNMKAVSTDLLTGLDNRNSYEMKTQNLASDNDNLFTYALFDLFRLKYVNDNYDHNTGDIYIKETAKILNKYWPKTEKRVVDGIEKQIDTGHCVYRIGGDEFVLLTNDENMELTKIKAALAAEEVSLINLGIEDDLPLGLNCGLTTHNPGEIIKETYKRADMLMSEDKNQMYETLGLERRRK